MATDRPPSSDLPLYLTLLSAFGLVAVCLTSLLGTAVVYVVAVLAGIAALGGLHYLLWGRSEE